MAGSGVGMVRRTGHLKRLRPTISTPVHSRRAAAANDPLQLDVWSHEAFAEGGELLVAADPAGAPVSVMVAPGPLSVGCADGSGPEAAWKRGAIESALPLVVQELAAPEVFGAKVKDAAAVLLNVDPDNVKLKWVKNAIEKRKGYPQNSLAQQPLKADVKFLMQEFVGNSHREQRNKKRKKHNDNNDRKDKIDKEGAKDDMLATGPLHGVCGEGSGLAAACQQGANESAGPLVAMEVVVPEGGEGSGLVAVYKQEAIESTRPLVMEFVGKISMDNTDEKRNKDNNDKKAKDNKDRNDDKKSSRDAPSGSSRAEHGVEKFAAQYFGNGAQTEEIADHAIERMELLVEKELHKANLTKKGDDCNMEEAKRVQAIYLKKASANSRSVGKQVDEAGAAVEFHAGKVHEQLRRATLAIQVALRLVEQMAEAHAAVVGGGRSAASAAMALLDAGACDPLLPCALQDRLEQDAPEKPKDEVAEVPRVCRFVLSQGLCKGQMCGRASCCTHTRQDAPTTTKEQAAKG